MHLGCSETEAARRVRRLNHDEKVALLRAYVGERRNRRHRPGRAFERTDYRFELVTDYGAFRDLQRHRMLTMEWQKLGISLGYDMPDLVEQAGLGGSYDEAIGRAESLYRTLLPDFPEQSSYAVALAHRIRYVLQCNAREAVHLIELRSGAQGHPAYRRVAQQMHRAIAEEAGHQAIAAAMSFVWTWDPTDLERLDSENAGPSAAGRKNLQRTDQDLPLSALVERPEMPLTAPPPECVLYPAVPFALSEFDSLAAGCALRGGCCERRRVALGVE